jgi:DNA modification methylase
VAGTQGIVVMGDISWANVTVRLGDLKAWGSNPRQSTKAQAKKLIESFEEFGQVETIAVSPELEVYNGHQRLSALMTIHGKDYQIDARQASRALTEQERKKLTIFLHAGATGSWDWDTLSGWDASEMISWGLDDTTLKEWKHDISGLGELLKSEKQEPVDAEPQIDKAEELRQKWGVETGQLWQLGEHRLICGDCTDKAVVERVMDIPLNLMVTDPHYGVDYDPAWRNEAAEKGLIAFAASREGKVENDDNADWSKAWELFEGNVVYCWHASLLAPVVLQSFDVNGFEVRSQIIWAKQNFAISRGHYHWKHETCFYFVRKGTSADWIGDHSQTTLWDVKWDKSIEGGHGTQKPVELMERSIANHDGDVYEPFCGSGTTMVACQNLNRKCRAIEISPAYCAVILERMSTAFPELEIKLQ